MLNLWVVVFSLIFVVSQAAQRLEIREALLHKPGNVYLSDIAEMEGFSPDSQRILSQILVTAEIGKNELRKLSDLAISDLLRPYWAQIKKAEQAAGKDFQLSLKMPKILEVYVSAEPWSPDKLRHKILQAIQNRCSDCQYEIENLRLPVVEYKKVRDWRLQMPSKALSGNFQIPLQVEFLDREKPQIFYVSGRLRLFRSLAIARRHLQAGERITASDLSFEKREINFQRQDIPRKEELTGAKAKRPILAGSVIHLSALEKERAVETGDLVDLVVRKESIELRMKGVAKGSGFIGDRIEVLNRSSKKILLGEISAQGEVVIQ